MSMREFLSGVLAAWTLAQLALAVFFLLAFALRRREVEYALFGLLCASLAVVTGASASAHMTDSAEARFAIARIAYLGGSIAPALNLHFVLRYTKQTVQRPVIMALYGSALLFLLLGAQGAFFDGYSLGQGWPWGTQSEHLRIKPTTIGVVFYAVAVSEFLLAIGVLVHAYRSGQREAVSALAGAAVMSLSAVNDVLVVTGNLTDSTYLSPHAFMFYAFSVASTLLLRYGRAANRLEETASSLNRQSEELRRSYAELRQMQEELVSKKQLAAVGEMAASIAHEVRNPLAVISNAIAGLRKRGLPTVDRETLLGIVDEETARLNQLVTDLLRFARPVRVKRSQVSLLELVRRSEAHISKAHSLRVCAPDDPKLLTIWADPGLFRLVFDNLVDNACQSMKSGGTVFVEVSRYEESGVCFLRIDIRDTGLGMETMILERALDPFFTTRPSGTGLGLPIVQRIMEAHGGRLELQSLPNSGTVASLFVPLDEPGEEEISAAE